MHDFDTARRERHAAREEAFKNRSFTAGGELFTFIPNVPFEVVRGVSSMSEDTKGTKVISTLLDTALGIIDGGPLEPVLDPKTGEPLLDDDGEVVLAPEAHQRFKRVCNDPEFPMTFEDLNEIVQWLIKEAVNRPTELPSDSSPTPARNGTGSTAASSGEPAVASKA